MDFRWLQSRRALSAFTLGVTLSVAVLVALSYQAVRGWKRSAVSQAEQMAQETADLLVRALARDMRGAQGKVLASGRWEEIMLDPPSMITLVASAFARFPYTESFFAWRADRPSDSTLFFFNRSARPPPWLSDGGSEARFPVFIAADPPFGRALLDRIRTDAARRRPYSVFETTIGSSPYQVVARLRYRDPVRRELVAAFGFVVRLDWAREHYFPEVTRQVARMRSAQGRFALTVLDSREETVALAGKGTGDLVVRRPMAGAFFDPALVEVDPPVDLAREHWWVEVRLADDGTLGAAVRGANRTLALAAAAGGALAIAVLLSAKAVRASAQLAEMRSDFVSSVTHEIKTPISTIRALGDTLVSGRVSEPSTFQEYAQLIVHEAKRLGRSMDNLLAYARVTDVTEAYRFEALLLGEVIDEVLGGFRTLLKERGLTVRLAVPTELPPVRADHTALVLLLENLVDNAIRYSGEGGSLDIEARLKADRIAVSIRDHGIGIPADEIGRVTMKFFRGRRSGSGGSGLGLAIAQRIARDHDTEIVIESQVDIGSTMTLSLPVLR